MSNSGSGSGLRPSITPPAIQGIKDDLASDTSWGIGHVRASFNPCRFDVWLTNVTRHWCCPICEAPAVSMGEHSRTRGRVYRWLLSEAETFVYFRLPIVECLEHGRYQIPLRCVYDQARWRVVHTLTPDEPV
jgi:hypothetical protein